MIEGAEQNNMLIVVLHWVTKVKASSLQANVAGQISLESQLMLAWGAHEKQTKSHAEEVASNAKGSASRCSTPR